ncbi:MAG: hypothetical protein V1645_04595, partial [archaeon]
TTIILINKRGITEAMPTYYPVKWRREKEEDSDLFEVMCLDKELRHEGIAAATKADRLGKELADYIYKKTPMDFGNGIFDFDFRPPLETRIFNPIFSEKLHIKVKQKDYDALRWDEQQDFLVVFKATLVEYEKKRREENPYYEELTLAEKTF